GGVLPSVSASPDPAGGLDRASPLYGSLGALPFAVLQHLARLITMSAEECAIVGRHLVRWIDTEVPAGEKREAASASLKLEEPVHHGPVGHKSTLKGDKRRHRLIRQREAVLVRPLRPLRSHLDKHWSDERTHQRMNLGLCPPVRPQDLCRN